MPYQNFAGWLGTGSLFMTVSAFLWRNHPIQLEPSELNFPLIVYLSNFGFATVMSLSVGFTIPVLLGLLLGVAPAVVFWYKGSNTPTTVTVEPVTKELTVANVKVALK